MKNKNFFFYLLNIIAINIVASKNEPTPIANIRAATDESKLEKELKDEVLEQAKIYQKTCRLRPFDDLLNDAWETIFFDAIEDPRGNIAKVERIIDLGKTSINYKEKSYDRTPLIQASLYNREKVVDLLIMHEAELDEQDVIGETALMKAAYNGNAAIVRSLGLSLN